VGNLLSAISGKFAKMIVLGTMFPVVILSVLNMLLVAPLLPLTASLPTLLQKIAVGDEKWPVVVLSFVVFVITGLLYDLNTPIIQLYEGYPWQASWIGKGLRRLEKRRFDKARLLSEEATAMRALMTGVNPGDPLLPDVIDQESTLSMFLNRRFPDDPSLLLPTQLGNVIRCFERYPYQAYGMDSIPLWPRLIAKIDAAFASSIDESKTSFDFMLNMSFLSGITALGIVAIGLSVRAPFQWAFISPWLWRAALFALVAVIFYYLSINRAAAWGAQVKSAFDLYRFPLLEALGYHQKPLSFQEERSIWLEISSQLLYAEARTAPLLYAEPLTRVIPYPVDSKLQVSRRFRRQDANLRIPVVIELTNLDRRRQVNSVTVIDTLPDGYKFVRDSASVSFGIVNVSQLAPPGFLVGPIPPGGTIEIRYAVKPATP
jgi:hypothetical protein